MNILYSTCFLGHPTGDPVRIERMKCWLDYYLKLKDQLGFDRIVLVDNASPLEALDKFDATQCSRCVHKLLVGRKDVLIYRFDEYLPRTSVWEYPYYWRGLNFLKGCIDESVDKVIHLDTDFYVLTPKLAEYIKNLNSGWTTLYTNKYKLPETAMWVLCKDSFKTFKDFPIPSFTHYNGKMAEDLLPFTTVNKAQFKGDRHGETFEKQTKDMDYYAQWQVGCPDMVFDLKE